MRKKRMRFFSLSFILSYNIAAMQYHGDIFLCRARALSPFRLCWSYS